MRAAAADDLPESGWLMASPSFQHIAFPSEKGPGLQLSCRWLTDQVGARGTPARTVSMTRPCLSQNTFSPSISGPRTSVHPDTGQAPRTPQRCGNRATKGLPSFAAVLHACAHLSFQMPNAPDPAKR